MTFKEYYSEINRNGDVFFISEHCGNKFCGCHMLFGFSTEADDCDELFSYQQDEVSRVSYIDPNQEIKLLEVGIEVKDSDDNVVELTFFKASPIPHPKKRVDKP